MTRGEFLDTLRQQLEGELSPAQIEGHIHYYREYIEQEIAAGKTEEEVLSELGSPVFIARTLLDTAEADAGEYGQETYQTDGYEQEPYQTDEYESKVHTWHVNPLVLRWGIPLVILAVLFLLLMLVGSMLAVIVRFFIPIMLVVLVINIFRKR